MSKYVIGYGLSVVLGIPVTYFWSCLLHKAVQELRKPEDSEANRIHWIPLAVGILERAVITTLVGWNVSGAASFVGAWIAVKSAGGWASWSKGTTFGRAILFIGLLGSAMSVLFGLVGGLIIGAR